MSLRFKPVRERREIETVARLAREIWLPHYQSIIGSAQVEYMLHHLQSAAAVQQQIEQGVSYLLLEYQQRAVGYFSFKAQAKCCFISKLYVLAELQGRGFGRRAMAFIEARARRAEQDVLALTVNKHNSDSIAAYQAWGFTVVKPVCMDIGGGFVMDDYRMEKAILRGHGIDDRLGGEYQ